MADGTLALAFVIFVFGIAAGMFLTLYIDKKVNSMDGLPSYQDLADALKPLASFTPRCFYELHDDHVIYQNAGQCLTAGDFRRAQEITALLGKP